MGRRLLSLLAAVAVAGCYDTPKPACIFLCGEGGACPEDYACSADDGRCHLQLSGGELAECPDTVPGHPDAAPAAPDAMIDATLCAAPLSPTTDGSAAGLQDLVLSEINPGDYIEVYNATGAPIALDATTYQLFSGPDSVAIDATGVGAGVTVAAHGYAQLGWPTAFTDTDAGGEVILFADDQLTAAASIMDFVCWGTNPRDSSKSLAETANKWTNNGACAAALTLGAIHRLPSTAGTRASDYDVTAAPSPTTCAP